MQLLPIVLLVAAAESTAAAGAARAFDRGELIADLERMIVTGEPHHSSHDEGELLQRALEKALQNRDPDLEQLAVRASASVDVGILRPIITSDGNPALYLNARVLLKLPRPVHYTAEILGSLDGGPLVALARIQSGQETFAGFDGLPDTSRAPGPHHVRLRARLTFEPTGVDAAPEMEDRDLRELVYAVFPRDSESAADARLFLYSPVSVSARSLDRALPDVPFVYWMNALLAARGAERLDDFYWMSAFCDEHERERVAPQARLDLCSVLQFQVGQSTGEIWFRTGRVAFTPDAVQWFASAPSVEVIRLRHPKPTELYQLSDLESLLDSPPDAWPAPDPFVAPEDIVVTPLSGKPNTARVSAIIRNQGNNDVEGLFIQIIAGDLDAPSTIRHFVRDIRRQDWIRLELDVTYPRGYGAVLVVLFPSLSDFTTWIVAPPDEPTPENNLTFRIINPKRAPARFAQWLASGVCRGQSGCRGY